MKSKNTSAYPNCGETIPINDGYVTWCHKCHWNAQEIDAIQPSIEKIIIDKYKERYLY